MIDAIFEGLFFGFVLSFMLGPSFFLILETSIKDGIKSALFLDLGVFLGDVVYIWVALKFFAQRSAIEAHENLITFITGLLLIVFGLYQFFKSDKKKNHDPSMIDPNALVPKTHNKYVRLAIKGFIINIINPTILLYWFGMIFVGYSKNMFDHHQMIVFLCAIMGSFFSIDVLKIIGARQLKKVVTPDFMHHLNRAIGVILMIFGLVMMVKGLKVFSPQA